MITVKPRAKISPEFIDAYREIVLDRLEGVDAQIRSRKGALRRKFIDEKRFVIGRLKAIADTNLQPGRGMDLEITRLRALGFQEFGVTTVNGARYMGGITPELIMEEYNSRNALVGKWDAGRFEIYIPVHDIIASRAHSIHMIPTRDRYVLSRHPHHRATKNREVNPLTYSPNTCWSGFGSPVVLALSEANVPELFRILSIFVGRYYNGSPLTSGFTTHMKRIS